MPVRVSFAYQSDQYQCCMPVPVPVPVLHTGAMTFECREHRLHLSDIFFAFEGQMNGEHTIRMTTRIAEFWTFNDPVECPDAMHT